MKDSCPARLNEFELLHTMMRVEKQHLTAGSEDFFFSCTRPSREVLEQLTGWGKLTAHKYKWRERSRKAKRYIYLCFLLQ